MGRDEVPTVDDFQAAMRRHRDDVYTFACYYLRHREDAEDVTQEVLIRLWKHWRRLDGEQVTAWLRRVTRNACCDLVRRRRTESRRPETLARFDDSEAERVADGEPGPHAEAEAADFRRRLTAALRELPEPHRSIVILREIQGLKYDEIAATLDKPLNTIKVYLHRGRKMLREHLQEEGSAHATTLDPQAAHV